jgi:monoamine oxidase
VEPEVVVADWGADPWSLGGYSYPRISALDEPATLAAPIDRTMFFAGEATCTQTHRGMIQGALDSGLRAAAEVATALAG